MRAEKPLGRHSLEVAFLRIAACRQLSYVNAADYKELGVIEGIAHELAHALDLGPDFERVLLSMKGVTANAHEVATLRIELTALAALGIHLSARRLWMTANWHDAGAPSLLSTPLNRHERRCVKRFVAIVNEVTRAR